MRKRIDSLMSVVEDCVKDDVRRSNARERELARALWEDLKEISPSHRAAAVRTLPECQTWAMVELLGAQSIRTVTPKPAEALELAELAVLAAEQQKAPWLIGYAWAFVANAHRVDEDRATADEVFETVRELWDPEAAEGVDPGRVPDLEASLRRDQRRFDEALALHDAALEVSRHPGRVWLNKMTTLEQMGDYPVASHALDQADRLMREKAPREELVLAFNRGVLLCHLGRHDEAAGLIPRILQLADSEGGRLDAIRCLWLRGRVAAGQGDLATAMTTLRLAAGEFRRRRMHYDVALVTVELGSVLLDAGRYPEARQRTREAAKHFQGLHPEARKAVQVYREALEREAATAELARRIAAFLYRARFNETLRFGNSL